LRCGLVEAQELRRHAFVLAATPIPYSTHDLALSMALQFFEQPKYGQRLKAAQASLKARLQAIAWFKEGLVVAPLVKSFENILYKMEKAAASPPLEPELKRMLDKVCGTPDVSTSTGAKAKPTIPLPDNSAPHDSVPDPLIAEAHALFEQMRSERSNEPLVPDGSSFDRAIVLKGAILGFATYSHTRFLHALRRTVQCD
jgi:hypothetical protein